MNIKIKNGYVDKPVDAGLDLQAEINRLKKEKNAVILAHYYTLPEVQDIADFVGDSLALSQKAAETDADVILFAGVHFMGETAKILSPAKTVIVPDLNAGCSLADSCREEDFARFISEHPEHTVVSYVNTTLGVKALTDIVCTSGNAVRIIESLPRESKIIFGPDRNLGNYIKSITGRENMVVWDGACHVHEQFSLEKILELKRENPGAEILAHPECKKPVQIAADFIGSTAAIIEHVKSSPKTTFIVVTEPGILHRMKRENPKKTFIAAPPEDSSCACNDCSFMKLITLEKIYLSLRYMQPEITVDETKRVKAERAIRRMLELSK